MKNPFETAYDTLKSGNVDREDANLRNLVREGYLDLWTW